MTGLTFQEFHDKLFYGADIELTVDKWHYMVYCGWEPTAEGSIHCIEVIQSDQPFYEQKVTPKVWKEIYKCKMSEGNKNIDRFLNAKIFDGVSFFDIEANVTVEYS